MVHLCILCIILKVHYIHVSRRKLRIKDTKDSLQQKGKTQMTENVKCDWVTIHLVDSLVCTLRLIPHSLAFIKSLSVHNYNCCAQCGRPSYPVHQEKGTMALAKQIRSGPSIIVLASPPGNRKVQCVCPVLHFGCLEKGCLD